MERRRPDLDQLPDEPADHSATYVLEDDELAELEDSALTAIVRQLSDLDRKG